MGVVSRRRGDELWVSTTTDAKATYNSTRFQLKLGSWPGRALQAAYKQSPDAFVRTLEKAVLHGKLGY